MRYLIISLLLCNYAFAQDAIIETSTAANFSPVEAFGIAISNNRAALVPAEIQARTSDQSIPVAIKAPDEASLIASILKDDSGTVVTSELESPAKAASKPECVNDITDKNLDSAQPALLQALVQVRAEKRALYQEKVSQLLSGEFLATLRRLETGFGLGGSVPLSADMSPYELSERISTLAVVLGNLESQKQNN